MEKLPKTFIVLAVITTLAFFTSLIVQAVKEVRFELNCTQYIKRAADANTIETAKEELSKAISYAEENNLTEGVVSIILHQPKNDVGYWYKNMTESYAELENLPEDATSLEKTNVLMKLRETLTDDKESGISVTVPGGISIYPYNALYFWFTIAFFIFSLAFWVAVWILHMDGY